MPEINGAIGGRWTILNGKRSEHLNRCRLCAKLTIPSLLPDEGVTENNSLPIPYQGLGARAVNNLTAKVLLTLFPPNTAFYRLDPDPKALEELKEMDPERKGVRQDLEKELRRIEQSSIQDFERLAMRTRLFEAIRQLVTLGNALLEIQDTGEVRTHRLDRYVVQRNPKGKVTEIIIMEHIHYEDIPPEVKEDLNFKPPLTHDLVEEPALPLYTQIKRENNRWVVQQEVGGVIVPDSRTAYPEDKLPFIVLTWTRETGNNYGRGHVEENLGDLNAFDSLSQSLLEGASAAAFLLILLNPNATTDIKDIRNARNGDVIVGREDDIGVLKVDKLNDFRIAYEQSKELAASIKQSFLLTESIQRHAERVTAEEIRYMAQELESALGGIYSVLGAELQRPFARILLTNQTKRGKLPKLPDEIETTIITGFDALGRGHDLQKLREFRDEVINIGQASGQTDIISTYIGLSNFFQRVATAIGLDTDGLVPEPEEIAQIQQQKEMYDKIMEVMNSGAMNQVLQGTMQQQQQGGM